MKSSNENTVVTAVDFLNGNLVITPEVTEYVVRYKTFLRKTAESIIGLATTLVEAEEGLNDLDFSIFCDEVGITKGDSTYSKLKKIGENSNRFAPFVDRLPNAWTTLYKLAKLEADVFDRLAPSLTPYTTEKEIQLQIGNTRDVKEKAVPDLKITFGYLDNTTKKEIYLIIDDLKKKYNFAMEANNSFISELKEASETKAA